MALFLFPSTANVTDRACIKRIPRRPLPVRAPLRHQFPSDRRRPGGGGVGDEGGLLEESGSFVDGGGGAVEQGHRRRRRPRRLLLGRGGHVSSLRRVVTWMPLLLDGF